MKSNFLQKLSQENLIEPLESNNSFLVETSFNSDIDMNIRQEIEYKFTKSTINSQYKFPRTTTKKTTHSKNPSAKSFENLKKNLTIHKSSKSSINPQLTESKPAEKSSSKPIRLILNFPTSTKIGVKKTQNTTRVYSSRFLNKTKNTDNRSPNQKKSLISIYSKHIKLTNNGVNSEIITKPSNSLSLTNKLARGGNTLRLRKIYQNVKMASLVNL